MRKMKTTLVILAAMLLCGILLLNAAAAEAIEGKDYSVRILERIPNEISRETAHDSAWYREDAVYARMMALKSSYPEGMPWTNDNTYSRTYLWYGGSWDGMRITYTGMGCVGFALIMSDAGFAAFTAHRLKALADKSNAEEALLEAQAKAKGGNA